MNKKLWSLIKNKYFITTVAFVVWLVFFDQNNLIQQQSLRGELHEVKKERQFYLDEIHHDTQKYLEVVSNKERLEKFAREKYLMKRDNEDVFLIVYE